jgi:hypothetical protein
MSLSSKDPKDPFVLKQKGGGMKLRSVRRPSSSSLNFVPRIDLLKKLILASSPQKKVGRRFTLNLEALSFENLIKMYVSYIVYVTQGRKEKKEKALVLLEFLALHPHGITLDSILSEMDKGFHPSRSSIYKQSLVKRLEKTFQRVRFLIKPFELDLLYHNKEKLYKITPLF